MTTSGSDWTGAGREGEGAPALIGVVKRRALLVVLTVLVAAAVAAGISRAQVPRYEASAQLLFSPLGPELQVLGLPATSGQDQDAQAGADLALVSARDVAARAARQSGQGSARDVERRVSVTSQGTTGVVQVTAFDDDPAGAAALANAYARAARDLRRGADARRAREARRVLAQQWTALSPIQRRSAQGVSLRGQLRQITALERIGTGSPELVERAVAATEPVAPRIRRNILLGALFGLLLGVAIAAVREQGDRRLRDRRQLESAFHMPILGQIPRARALSRRRRFSDLPPAVAEAFRLLQANVRYGRAGEGGRRLVVTSAAPADGKSTVAWNLAAAAAGAGLRVLLIEGDLRRPDFARRAGLAPEPGLSDVLRGGVDIADVAQEVPITQGTNGSRQTARMSVLVAGRAAANVGELFQSAWLPHVLDEAGQQHDLVVIDAPPLPVVADAVPLVRLGDGVVVVARLGRATEEQATQLRHQLATLDAPVLGLVANGVGAGQMGAAGYVRRPVTA